MADHFVEVPKKVLSPAAQAVVDAYYNAAKAVLDICGDFEIGSARNEGIAAAIRALADQVVPAEQHPPRRGMRPGGTGALSPDEGAEDQRAATRRKILAIAAELGN